MQTGDPSALWFNALSQETKSKVLVAVPGNHDFWVHGSPTVWTKDDQLANGFMQFYAQDSRGAAGDIPYNFTAKPDSRENLPDTSNFFFYNKIGNTGLIGFSGAHDFDTSKSLFVEACQWASSTNLDVLLLLGSFTK